MRRRGKGKIPIRLRGSNYLTREGGEEKGSSRPGQTQLSIITPTTWIRRGEEGRETLRPSRRLPAPGKKGGGREEMGRRAILLPRARHFMANTKRGKKKKKIMEEGVAPVFKSH